MPLIEYILSTIAPHECVNCGHEGSLICSICTEQIKRVPSRCYQCQQITSGFRTCPTCRRNAGLYAVYPFTVYEGAPKQLLHKIKFERLRSGAETVARCMAPMLADLPAGILVTHVPTATSRIRERGYDQAAEVARHLAAIMGYEYTPLLSRYGQQRQVGKNRQERREQMQTLFAATKRAALQNKHILLIDDVLTTGATLEACAATLKEAGARRVSAAVFAAA